MLRYHYISDVLPALFESSTGRNEEEIPNLMEKALSLAEGMQYPELRKDMVEYALPALFKSSIGYSSELIVKALNLAEGVQVPKLKCNFVEYALPALFETSIGRGEEEIENLIRKSKILSEGINPEVVEDFLTYVLPTLFKLSAGYSAQLAMQALNLAEGMQYPLLSYYVGYLLPSVFRSSTRRSEEEIESLMRMTKTIFIKEFKVPGFREALSDLLKASTDRSVHLVLQALTLAEGFKNDKINDLIRGLTALFELTSLSEKSLIKVLLMIQRFEDDNEKNYFLESLSKIPGEEIIGWIDSQYAQYSNTPVSPASESRPLVDPAMSEDTKQTSENLGGIDLNPNLTDIGVLNGQDGNDLQFKTLLSPDVPINGLVPVIINITPTINLNILLGL